MLKANERYNGGCYNEVAVYCLNLKLANFYQELASCLRYFPLTILSFFCGLFLFNVYFSQMSNKINY